MVKEVDTIFKNLEETKENIRSAIMKVRAAKEVVGGFKGNARTVLNQQLEALENALKQTVVGSAQYSVNNLTEYVDRLPAETFRGDTAEMDDVFGESIPRASRELDDLTSNSDIDLTPQRSASLREAQKVLNRYIRAELKPKRESKATGVLDFKTLREEYNRNQDNSDLDFSHSFEDFIPDDMFAQDHEYLSLRESQNQKQQEQYQLAQEHLNQERLQESQELVNMVLSSTGSGSSGLGARRTIRESSKKSFNFDEISPMGEETSLNGISLEGMGKQGIDTSVSFAV